MLTGDINGPPNKPLPSEPPSHSDLISNSSQANSTFLSNNVHENNEDVAQSGESGGENSCQTSPPSSPDS